jgi:hypothetical protein
MVGRQGPTHGGTGGRGRRVLAPAAAWHARRWLSRPAFLLGLVTAIFGVTLIIVLAFTICLSPVSLIGASQRPLDPRLGCPGIEVDGAAQSFKRLAPATQAGVGTLVLSLAVMPLG